MSKLQRRLKTLLNTLIDETVHPRRKPKDLSEIVVDEALHAVVEGGFRPDKFARYTLFPLLFEKKKRKRRRRRRSSRTL